MSSAFGGSGSSFRQSIAHRTLPGAYYEDVLGLTDPQEIAEFFNVDLPDDTTDKQAMARFRLKVYAKWQWLLASAIQDEGQSIYNDPDRLDELLDQADIA